jgi:mono/diheme cytochrome c family protein
MRRGASTLRAVRRAALALAWLVPVAATAQAPAPPLERGRYLVESILACGNCHTPKSASGEPIASRNLSGGGLTFNVPPFSGPASNITPDRDSGIGTWSDEDIKRAIVAGKRPNHGRLANTELAVVMATPFFAALTPADLDAVVTYLRAVPPIRNVTAAPEYRMPQRHQPLPGTSEAGRRLTNAVERGRYLVTLGHCLECHSPQEKGVMNYERLGAGGRVFNADIVQGFPQDWPGARAPNITSHPSAGLGSWSDAEIKRAISSGIARDGRRLQPPMPFAYYARLTPADLDDIVAYLRTLPPQP